MTSGASDGVGTPGTPLVSGPRLLSASFNQNFECVACGAQKGFRVYNVTPFGKTLQRDFGGGIARVEMLFRSNILALVGGGRSAAYPPNKVMIWDDHQSRCIGELSFRKEVRAVRLRRDRVVVALEHKVYVYNFSDLKLLHQIETASNTIGLVALSPGSASTVLACPGIHSGQVRVELYDLRRTKFINAHDGALACLSLSLDGSTLATASERGTLVRVWNAAEGTMLHELRRGADRAHIYSIAFAPEAPLLAVSSERGTVHLFSLADKGGGSDGSAHNLPGAGGGAQVQQVGGSGGGDEASTARANKKSTFGWLGGVLPKYFKVRPRAVRPRHQCGLAAWARAETPGVSQARSARRPTSSHARRVPEADRPNSSCTLRVPAHPALRQQSEWSFMQFKLTEGVPSSVAFAGPNELVAALVDGTFYRFEFNAASGEGKQVAVERLITDEESEAAGETVGGGV